MPDQDLEGWLVELGCAELAPLLRERFGAEAVADLQLLEDAEVQELTAGLLPIPKRKFLRELSKIAGGGAAAAGCVSLPPFFRVALPPPIHPSLDSLSVTLSKSSARSEAVLELPSRPAAHARGCVQASPASPSPLSSPSVPP